jgi:predicted metal-dependent hydrolase
MSDAPSVDTAVLPDYELVRSHRRTLAIHVLPDGRLEVRAPLRTPVRTISAFVASKSAWIVKALGNRTRNSERVLWREGPLREGDVVHMRGIPHQVKTVPRRSRADRIHAVPAGTQESMADVLIPLREVEDTARRQLLEWYRHDLAERVRLALPEATHLVGATPSIVTLRLARSRWGSCGSKGRISLNLLCSALPDRLFEYVLIHELCHLVHLDHGRAFWTRLLSVLPDAVERRRELRGWYLR